MANVLNLSYEQSSDAKTLTIVDESTLDNPIANYVRTVELWTGTNATGSLIDTLTFVGVQLTVSKAITSDMYFSAKLIHTGSPSVATKIINFGTTQFEYNALDKLLLKNCGCSNTKGCDKITLGSIYLTRAQDQVLAGNSAKFNSFIQSSFKILNG
jgi:hypothetical protein